jgi:(R)-amidase
VVVQIQLAQITSEDGVVASNLIRILNVIQDADEQTDLIVFPENCLMGFPTHDQVWRIAEPENGPTITTVLDAVKQKGVSVAVGFAEADKGHFYNTTVLLSPDGIVLKYRKTHLWSSDVGVFEPGNELVTAMWKGIRVGILICFDIEFPENARTLAAQGAELLIVTNANMDPFGPVHRSLVIARALENQIFAVMANRCGSGGGLIFAGESVVVSPAGNIVAAMGREEGSQVAKIDLAEVAQSRTDYNYLKLRRIPLASGEVVSNGETTKQKIL